jgi:hypothetical protein
VFALSMLAGVVMVWSLVLIGHRRLLAGSWREPVFREPVLIVESDDWGPGPQAHVLALRRICEVLRRRRDRHGRAAVMTIGVVLAVPDNAAIRGAGYRRYVRTSLLDPGFVPMRSALDDGRAAGVLSLQLHGLEHLWPTAFLQAAAHDPVVRQWIDETSGIDTEGLPPAIQSRWTDAASLPSRPLDGERIREAVREETQHFALCFGVPAEVAVPPTFVWNGEVERAWAACGVRTIITPGRRHTARGADGRPAAVDRSMRNGDTADGGCLYLVRDIYFEPALGHTAKRALEAALQRFRLGRPALFETHRFNFVGEAATADKSLAELERLLDGALRALPALRFMSSAELADAVRRNDAALLEGDFRRRAVIWLRRLAAHTRLRRLAWLTGLALPAGLLYLLGGGATAARPPSMLEGSR